jgi:hypothetical protein
MDAINRDLDALAEELALYRLALCLIDLKNRSDRDDLIDWLRFAPDNDNDEALLDSAIECLVITQLATIDAAPMDTGGYVYHLHPNWPAIIARLSDTAVAPELLAWLKSQTKS